MVLVVPATFGLLPGLTIFRGLYELVDPTGTKGLLVVQSGITTLLGAGAILLAIATGTVFGEILASPFDRRTRGESSRVIAAEPSAGTPPGDAGDAEDGVADRHEAYRGHDGDSGP